MIIFVVGLVVVFVGIIGIVGLNLGFVGGIIVVRGNGVIKVWYGLDKWKKS